MLRTSRAVLAIGLLLPMGLVAQRHPGYSHALQDLRFARAVLERNEGWGRVAADEGRATGEIDRAIEELRRAAMDDGRNPNDHPPVDMRWEPRDRLHRAMEALDQARDRIGREEDNSSAREWRNRAFRHIDEARRALRHAMETWR